MEKIAKYSNITSKAEQDLYNFALNLFSDAVAKRTDLVDNKVDIRNDLYDGKPTSINDSDNSGPKLNNCHRNMCFELIETQINNGQPMPKITPTKAAKATLAHMLEKWLRNEMDRLQGEQINDRVERGVLKQGTHFYCVSWDDSIRVGNRQGAICIKDKPIQLVWPQPGVIDFNLCDYVFVKDTVSMRTLKSVTGYTDIPESPNYKGLVDTITYWYYDEDGYVCRFVWVENTEYVLFNDQDYESRRVRVCKTCGEVTNEVVCPVCGSTDFGYKVQRMEILKDDIVKGNPNNQDEEPVTLAKKGDAIPYYAMRRIPIVCRVNISSDLSMYGISDIDMLEQNQKTSNAVTTKIKENILKAGSLVVLPSGVNLKLNNETLKVCRVKDPKMAQSIDVKNLQANISQDDILAERAYQYGRAALGITDSYQGKRDPTAESGKAKEIAAAQSAGRMESKRRMKDAAYADLYFMMFQLFLAYDDVREKVMLGEDDGSLLSADISRYDFLDGKPGNLYYDDSFLFSVDTASVLYTSRESLWRETTTNFVSGTMGDPAAPATQMLYWSVMSELNYPLAQKCLMQITQNLENQARALEAQQKIVKQTNKTSTTNKEPIPDTSQKSTTSEGSKKSKIQPITPDSLMKS